MSLRKTNPIARCSVLNSFFAIIALVSVSAASICLTGCEKSTGTSQTGGATSGARQFVTIGTAPGGGTFALVGNAVANTLEANKGDLNWSVSAKGTKGTQENIRKLESKEIEFGMANAGISYFATRGEGNWKTKRDIQVLSLIHI